MILRKITNSNTTRFTLNCSVENKVKTVMYDELISDGKSRICKLVKKPSDQDWAVHIILGEFTVSDLRKIQRLANSI